MGPGCANLDRRRRAGTAAGAASRALAAFICMGASVCVWAGGRRTWPSGGSQVGQPLAPHSLTLIEATQTPLCAAHIWPAR